MSTRTSKIIKERNDALFSLDRNKIERYMRKYDITIPEDSIVFWGAVYKDICNIPAAPPELVGQARVWLYAHGMSEKFRFP